VQILSRFPMASQLPRPAYTNRRSKKKQQQNGVKYSTIKHLINMAAIYYWLKEMFWSEYFWLPAETSWADLRRNETVFYPDASDMLIPIPMAVGLFVIRLLWERYTAWL